MIDGQTPPRASRGRAAALDDLFIAILRRHLRYLAPSEGLAPDTPLRALGLDSMEAVALVLDLESAFGVTLPESSLRPETFASAASLWAEVVESMEGGSHGR